MTEKIFDYKGGSDEICQITIRGIIFRCDEFIDVVNNGYDNLLQENFRWKRKFRNEKKKLIETRNELIEKNKELKTQISELKAIVGCHNCDFHDYDEYDDGDYIEVCRAGHNEELCNKGFCKYWIKL